MIDSASRQSETLGTATQRALQAWLAGQAPRAAGIPGYWLARAGAERGRFVDNEHAIVRVDWLLHGFELAAASCPVEPTGNPWTENQVQRAVSTLALAGQFAQAWDQLELGNDGHPVPLDDDEADSNLTSQRRTRDATAALAIRLARALFPTSPAVAKQISSPPFARVGLRFYDGVGLRYTARLAPADVLDQDMLISLRSEAEALIAVERPARLVDPEVAVRLLDARLRHAPRRR
jgi:hypothetical protein